jgi:hypothetical protein
VKSGGFGEVPGGFSGSGGFGQRSAVLELFLIDSQGFDPAGGSTMIPLLSRA